jgi:two-component system nitrogen regulation response regulator NtrX
MSADILIVDDEADIRDLVAGILQDEGYDARTARNSDDALAAIVARKPNLVFLDIWLQGSKLDGLQLLDIIKREHPEVPLVMISGHGNIETAVAAIKHGAYDFIEKPFDENRLLASIRNALEQGREQRSNAAELEQLQSKFNSLSLRQRQVMELAVAGLSSKEIGIRLKISSKTVENHRPGSWSGSVRAIWQSSYVWRCKSSYGHRAVSDR